LLHIRRRLSLRCCWTPRPRRSSCCWTKRSRRWSRCSTLQAPRCSSRCRLNRCCSKPPWCRPDCPPLGRIRRLRRRRRCCFRPRRPRHRSASYCTPQTQGRQHSISHKAPRGLPLRKYNLCGSRLPCTIAVRRFQRSSPTVWVGNVMVCAMAYFLGRCCAFRELPNLQYGLGGSSSTRSYRHSRTGYCWGGCDALC
jgi:hypothetical protein